MQLHKILQYSLFDLIRILAFRIIYKVRLFFRKAYVSVFNPHYSILPSTRGVAECYLEINKSLSTYYHYISNDYSTIKDNADSIVSGKMTMFGQVFPFNPQKDWLKDPVSGNYWPQDVFWEDAFFVEAGLSDVKYVLEVNKFNDMVVLAQAYQTYKEEEYVKLIDFYLDGWLSCVPVEKSVVNKITMDFGFRIINLIHISLLCYDSTYYVEKVHPKVMGIISHHVSHIWSNLSSRWFKSGNDNNHNIGEIVGLYIGQLWLKKFGYYLHLDKIEKEIDYLRNVTERMIAPTGCYLEQSANYTRVVHDFFVMFEIFRHSLDTNRDFGWFDRSHYFERLSNYLLTISYHGQLPNFGDNDYARVVIPFDEKNNAVASVRKHYFKKITPIDYSCDGQWVFHSADKNDVFIFGRSGIFSQFVEGASVHVHNDLLALILSAKGKNIFIDKGTLFYNSGMEVRKEYSSTKAHNTIQIENREMADFLPIGFSHYPKSKNVISSYNNTECSFKGEVSYSDVNHIREIDYDGKKIRIQDDITKQNPNEELGYVHFLLGEDIRYSLQNEEIILSSDDDAVLCKVTFNGVDGVKVKETFYAPHYAYKAETHIIEGFFKIEKYKHLVTSIEFV